MKTDNYYDRTGVSLENFIEDRRIAPRLVEMRSDFARSEALRHFFAAKSAGDFYLEDILNSFIALVQYPLNFAIFFEDGDALDFKVHFCADKEHEEAFVAGLKVGEAWETQQVGDVFQVFPAILDEPRVFLAVYHMHTKHGPFHKIKPEHSCFPKQNDNGSIEEFQPHIPSIETSEQYIASCADHFFQFAWDVFASEFGSLAEEYLLASVEKLVSGRASWNEKAETLRSDLVAVPQPEGGRERWKRTLEETFAVVLNDSSSGIDLVSSMMRPSIITATDTSTTSAYPPNMLLAFRSFSRQPGECRHNTGNGMPGYLYDSSFLISDGITQKYRNLLKDLRNIGATSKDKSRESYGSEFQQRVQASFPKMRLYSGVPRASDCIDVRQSVLDVLDADFWSRLVEGNGVDESIDILSSWVGDSIRSLVDPVYHTGLIHTNHLFEWGGLDRIGGLVGREVGSIEDIPAAELNDARRVVVLYYVLASLVKWGSGPEPFDPSKLAAVLVPIKMRGSVWGVTIHGVYAPEYETIFADQRYWQGYFKLATDHRQKNAQIYDRYLWNLAEEAVSDFFRTLLLPEILAKDGSFERGLDRINASLGSGERFSPFAFPQFRLAEQPREDGNSIELVADTELECWLSWEILDNSFFTAHQKWDKRATRKFRQVVEHGIFRGTNLRAKNSFKVVGGVESA